jgi:hypothetical protein
MVTKEDVKNISPTLSSNKAWHTYVDWFWQYEFMRKNYENLAVGFQAGSLSTSVDTAFKSVLG